MTRALAIVRLCRARSAEIDAEESLACAEAWRAEAAALDPGATELPPNYTTIAYMAGGLDDEMAAVRMVEKWLKAKEKAP